MYACCIKHIKDVAKEEQDYAELESLQNILRLYVYPT